jgi:DNA-binding transcriptional ArsR family regulator
MVTDVGPIFDALADPTRRAVIALLSERSQRAGEIAARTGMSGPAMSRHLRVLLSARIVIDTRLPTDARVRVFSLRPESMTAIQAWLDQIQAHWTEQLASFKRHIEEGHQP